MKLVQQADELEDIHSKDRDEEYSTVSLYQPVHTHAHTHTPV